MAVCSSAACLGRSAHPTEEILYGIRARDFLKLSLALEEEDARVRTIIIHSKIVLVFLAWPRPTIVMTSLKHKEVPRHVRSILPLIN